ncbi:MAG: hypothetical protein FWH17_00615 [Oscillospiraceae bacterium]|nr:hypothetical protein [Oscillospiraceae bacterium]
MRLDILIDKLTPCLVEAATGKVLQTTFSLATADDISGLKDKGWRFDWADAGLSYCNIYKLQIKGDDVIQGLVAAEIIRGAVYVRLMESAPHNQSSNKAYEGVGGHLFAIAIKLSIALDFGGYICFEAKNPELAEHYAVQFGAKLLRTRIHDYRMDIDEKEAYKLIEMYTLEGDLDVRR